MGLVEIFGIALERHRHMLLERGRTGERGGVEPAAHGDDHGAANGHGGKQSQPLHA
ncbi:hypothetical protein D3C72_1894580 [compost metagenome]